MIFDCYFVHAYSVLRHAYIFIFADLNTLTRWLPAYDIFVLRFRPKNSSFRLPYQRPSSSADCARELFNSSNGSASLVDCTHKKFSWLGVWIFCDWRHKWSSFRVILGHVSWPRAQLLGQSVSLKFSLETRLESVSFEPLINFLAFLVQKLWSKINKLTILTYITSFEPETPAGHPKYQKTRIVAYFPVKTSAKYYPLTVGAQGQAKWAKVA